MKIDFGFRLRVRREPTILQVVDSDGTVTEIEVDTEVAKAVVGFAPNEVGDEVDDEG